MLSDNIRTLRQARGLLQTDLAKILGVSKQSVSNWENDNIQPSIDMLVKIASFFGVSCDYIIGRDTSETIDAAGLTKEEKAHIQLLVDDIRQYKKLK